MADSPYTGTARATEGGGNAKPGRAADLPSKGGIMGPMSPSESGGKAPTCSSKYAASARGTEGQDGED